MNKFFGQLNASLSHVVMEQRERDAKKKKPEKMKCEFVMTKLITWISSTGVKLGAEVTVGETTAVGIRIG